MLYAGMCLLECTCKQWGQLWDHDLNLGVFILLFVLHHNLSDNMLMDLSYCQIKYYVGLTFLF